MTLVTTTFVLRVECSVRDCTARLTAGTGVAFHTPAHARFIGLVLAEGWVERIGRSNRWYCKAHAARAGRCVKGKWGACSKHCPVHGHGHVVSWASEDARRLAGRHNRLSEADRARGREHW